MATALNISRPLIQLLHIETCERTPTTQATQPSQTSSASTSFPGHLLWKIGLSRPLPPLPRPLPMNKEKTMRTKLVQGSWGLKGYKKKNWGSMYSQSPMALFHSARIDSFFRSPGSMAKMLRLQESKDLPLPNHCLSPVWNPDRTRVIKIIFLLTINFKFSFKRRPQKITN